MVAKKDIVLYGFKKKGELIIRKEKRNGQQRMLFRLGFTEDQLKQAIIENIDRFIYEGYSGRFTTFAEPKVEHGDRLNFVDVKFPERNGRYLIKDVETRFGINGGHRIILIVDHC